MKFHLLRYFCVLAEELHFGRAADKLSITQPPLSSAIKTLEQEVGTQLLLRDSKNVELTAAGVIFLEEARYILERVDRAGGMARAVAKGIRGRLDVGMTGSLLYREIPAIASQFSHDMPGIELVLREMSTVEQLGGLLHGQIHAGFINAVAVPAQLASMPLNEDHFVLCLPSSHRHAHQAMVSLSELADESFVMFSRDVAPANHDNVIAIFSRAGIHPRTSHAARQWLTVVAMVSRGLGIALVPNSLALSRVEGVQFVPVASEPAAAPALLVWSAAQLNPALAGFLKVATAVIAAQKDRRTS